MSTFLERLKTLLFRWIYRITTARPWRDHSPGADLKISNLQIPTRAGQVAARMYHGDADRPLIVYFHGGGWVIGDLNTHDPFARAMSAASKCTLMSIDYRLAPEHRFPAAHEDCLDATNWIAGNLNTLAPNNGTVVLAGDSAGGNLVACTAASILGEPRLAGALMIYPTTEHYLANLPSYVTQAKTGPLTSAIMRWFYDTYLGDTAPADPSTKTVFVGRRCDYTSFPPSLIVTAERDPLKDDGKRLAIVMRQAGVEVTYQHFEREAHDFVAMSGPSRGHQEFLALATDWLEAFRTPIR